MDENIINPGEKEAEENAPVQETAENTSAPAAEEAPAEETAAAPEETTEEAAEEKAEEKTEETAEKTAPAGEPSAKNKPAPQKKKGKGALIAVIAVAAAVAAAALVFIIGGKNKPAEETTLPAEQTTVAEETSQGGAVLPAEETSAEEETTEAEETTAAEETSAEEETTEAEETTVPEETTSAAAEETTAAAEETTAASAGPVCRQYDIYRSGRFYATGSLVDSEGTAPMEMAITPDSVYMLSEFSEDAYLGILVVGKQTYIVYPEKKVYLEMNSGILKLMGIDSEELFDTSGVNFTDLEDLKDADRTELCDINGTTCTSYYFNNDDNTASIIYCEGDTLLRVAITDETGKIFQYTDFETVTGDVPAGKCGVPEDYEKIGLTKFMKICEDLL